MQLSRAMRSWMRTRKPAALLALALAVPGCKKSESGQKPAPEPTPVTAEPADAAAPSAPASGIDWIADDYPAALARARETGKPLLVDMWAPWCHTCLSMKQTVLADAGLASFADRFVWLALDTDKPKNAGPVSKLEVTVWPSFFILSPADESVAARLRGGVTVSQMRDFLAEGERAVREGAELEKDSPLWHLREADRHAAAGEHAEAAEAYGRALEAAPPDWARRADVLVSRTSSLAAAGETEACIRLAAESIDETVPAKSASTADMAYYAHACAEAEGGDAAAKLRPTLIAAIEKVLEDPDAGLSVDDRSDALAKLREYYLAQGEEQKALMAAGRQRKLLDRAVAEASSPREIMTYSYPRAEVYTYLGIPEKLLGELEKLAKDLPEEYDPPYRVAWLLLQMGEPARAMSWANKALELAYGPRKGLVMSLIAAIHESAGNAAAARKTREEQLAYLEGLPEGHRSEAAIEHVKAQLAGSL